MASRSAPSSFIDELPEEHVLPRLASPHWRRRRARRAGAVEPDRTFAWQRRVERGSDRVAGPGGSAGGGRSALPGELEYDYDDSQVPLALTPGVRVIHPRFGAGEVLQVYGFGREARADIAFEEVGRKKVVVAYAGLRPA